LKRCDCERRLYCIRVTAKRTRRRLRVRRQGKSGRIHASRGAEVIKAPEVFSLADPNSRWSVLAFLRRLERLTCHRQHGHVVIDFAPTKRMIADGTLLLRAELSHLVTCGKIRCLPPHNPRVSQVLQQVGIYTLLKYKTDVKTTFVDVVHWRVAQGVEAQGEKFDDILGHYDGVVPDQLLKGLYVGVTEAMTNTQQHAYIGSRGDEHSPRRGPEQGWWMFSQQKDDYLSVVFCDLGVGIPRSLPERQPGLWERLRRTFGSVPADADTIQAAVQESLTRTRQPHRGKGLRQLVDVIKSSPGGRLAIFSNHGCYSLLNNQESTRNFLDSIDGTLINWRLPMKGDEQ
jgi:hypothetical protein